MQRDVLISVADCDKHGTFIGTLTLPSQGGKNLALILLEVNIRYFFFLQSGNVTWVPFMLLTHVTN